MKKLLILLPALTMLCSCGTMHYEGAVKASTPTEENHSISEDPQPASGFMWKHDQTGNEL